MLLFLAVVAIALGSVIVVFVGGGLVVLLAYGLGWLLTRFLPLAPFEATVLSLLGMGMAGVVAWRVLTAVVTLPSPLSLDDDEEEEVEDWADEEEDVEAAGEPDDRDASPGPAADRYPGVPRWRRPRRVLDFSNTKPDDRCPCGSGRKYKNCHGRKARA